MKTEWADAFSGMTRTNIGTSWLVMTLWTVSLKTVNVFTLKDIIKHLNAYTNVIVKLEQFHLAYYFLQSAYEENPNNDRVAFLYSLRMVEENRKNEIKDILLSIIK